MRAGRSKVRATILVGIAVITGIFYFSAVDQLEVATLARSTFSSAQLVSIEELPDLAQLCLPESGNADASPIAGLEENRLFAAFRERPVYAGSQEDRQTVETTRPAVRNILDTDPIYSSVAVDVRNNEVFLQDTNTWSIRIFNRLDETPRNATRTEPKRVISGAATGIQFNTCIYIDPKNGDIYTVENDIGDSIAVFSQDASGNVAPVRRLKVTHRAYSMTVDEEKEELFVTVQYPPQVEVYRKMASGNEKPLRVLSGESTRLSDVHGIAIDVKNRLVFVNNWGNISDYDKPGTGRFEAPSITVYPLDAKDDTAPLRVIQGPKTQLDWPGSMSLDPATGDVYVANDLGQSIIVFRGTDQGDVAPRRIIKGDRTGISYPTSVFVDTTNSELWVSNMGNA